MYLHKVSIMASIMSTQRKVTKKIAIKGVGIRYLIGKSKFYFTLKRTMKIKNIKHNISLSLILMILMSFGLVGCIEDGYTSSPNDRPTFSTDTVNMGMVITTDLSTTQRFTVRNPHSKGLLISDIRVDGPNAEYFRVNVDGFSGTTFSNVEIRANDSIYVLVSCLLPENNVNSPVDIHANILFNTNGGTDRVVLKATGQNVTRLYGEVVTGQTTFEPTKPYQVFDSLVVAPDATLVLPPGTTLMFHDKAYMRVYGTLKSQGTVEAPNILRGDRTGDVISGITFDLMAGQWIGVDFMPGSKGNSLYHTEIRNTVQGVVAEESQLELVNSKLRNSQFRALSVQGTDVTAVGCEFAEAPYGTVFVAGGTSTFDHCTFPNYYLFSAIYEPAVIFTHLNDETALEDYNGPYTKATVTNSILYGLGSDIYPGNLDGTDVYLHNCLLKSAGSDDEHFTNCLWDADPLYYTVRDDYVFDYRLKEGSPAIAAGNAALSTHPAAAYDAYGKARGTTPDLGAYVFTAQ